MPTKKIPKLILRPNYAQFGTRAPIERNKMIVELSDMVVAICDGQSRGTKFTIEYAKRPKKQLKLHIISDKPHTLVEQINIFEY